MPTLFDRSGPYASMVVCWIAVMCSSITAASAKTPVIPFDIMVGCWNGKAQVYDQQGSHLGMVNSHGKVYWKKRYSLLHFEQGGGGPTLAFDLQVSGKTAKFQSPQRDVTGTDVTGKKDLGVYHFQLNFKVGGPAVGNWYNNHYFTDRNTRMVLGPFVSPTNDGELKVKQIAVQTLKRVPCAGSKH